MNRASEPDPPSSARLAQRSPGAPRGLRETFDGLDLFSREGRPSLEQESTYSPSLADRGGEHRRVEPHKSCRPILDLQSVAEIGPVGAILLQRFGMRHADEGRWSLNSRSLRRESDHEALHPAEDVVGVDEGRLDIDLCELGLAIGPQILVPEAPRDLKIAIEACRHTELLIDLWTLRQRVEFSVVQTARHEIVACALGSRLGQNRSLDLHEPKPVQVVSACEDQPVSKLEVRLKLRAAEIQHTMLQSEFLGR